MAMPAPGFVMSVADVGGLLKLAPTLERSSRELRLCSVAPTMATRLHALEVVLIFIRERRRKVYGGYALNAHVWACSPAHSFYGAPVTARGGGSSEGAAHAQTQPLPAMMASDVDIEFYSPDPVADAVELCNCLARLGHSHVQAKEAVHRDTFAVTVDFTRICDITFAPPRVYEAIPAMDPLGDGIAYVTPHHACLDLLSQLSDPVLSHWRITHVLGRLQVLQTLFGAVAPPTPGLPLEDAARPPKSPTQAGYDHGVLTTALQACTSLVWLGSHALGTLFPAAQGGAPEDLAQAARDLEFMAGLEAVSVYFDEDVKRLQMMLAPLQPSYRLDLHAPLLDLVGRRAVLRPCRPGAAPLLTLHDNRDRAVPSLPCAVSGNSMCYTASCSYIIFAALARAFLARVDGEPRLAACQHNFAWRLGAARSARVGAPLDIGSPLRDVHLVLMGETRSPMHAHKLNTDARRARFGPRATAWFKYSPPPAMAPQPPRLQDLSVPPQRPSAPNVQPFYPFIARAGQRMSAASAAPTHVDRRGAADQQPRINHGALRQRGGRRRGGRGTHLPPCTPPLSESCCEARGATAPSSITDADAERDLGADASGCAGISLP